MINEDALTGEAGILRNQICTPQELIIENVKLARAYVPFQYMCELFSPVETLINGTAFPELFSPFDVEDLYFTPRQLCVNVEEENHDEQ